MAKHDDDDFMNSLSDWDDDDLLLLDPEAGKFETPSAQSGKKSSAQSAPRSRSDASGSSSPRTASEGRGGRKESRGRGGLIVLIIILIILIIAIAVFLFKLNAAGGKLSALFGSTEQTEAVDDTETDAAADDDTSAADETETEEADETETEDTADTEDDGETEEEPLVVESEETSSDLSGLALLELYGEDFTPDLVYVSYYGVHQGTGDLQVDSSLTANLASFIAAAQEAGYGTMLSTCYYEAGTGNSDEAQEHATGLAVDFVDVNAQVKATFASDETYADEIAWLADNAADYGFILRYPEGKEDLTGVDYVPYHFVYVGTTIAQEMAENDWCLEEYLAQ